MAVLNKHPMLTVLIILKRRKKSANENHKKNRKEYRGLEPQIWIEIIVVHLFQHLFLQNTITSKTISGNLISLTAWVHFLVHSCKFRYQC